MAEFTPLQGNMSEVQRTYWVVEYRPADGAAWERLPHERMGLPYLVELKDHDAKVLGNGFGLLSEGKAMEILAYLCRELETLKETNHIGYSQVDYRVCVVEETTAVQYPRPTVVVNRPKR